MKLITKAMKASTAAERWKEQYYNEKDGWRDTRYLDTEIVYNKLIALGSNPNPSDVNTIIGNDSWTDLQCDECGGHKESIIQVGQEPDYESSTADLCLYCLNAALNIYKGV